ncbi:DUF2690 domain-containing protein [Streptomyces sp. NPDC005423]|uniref:helix-turn-helix domain-containing protein n=1 Tax=Streptomyces sp. NPDC005423 TaxID=3155343 RepID=UPI0033A1E46B
MPRWKALPDELDPQVREFAGQLRRLVDRSGLSVAALADRTGYGRTSWYRYLDGRLLAPKGAVVALAEVTGAHPVHLITLWELAERAWSRSELRHDSTMEAIRISQARAALGEFGPPPADAGPRVNGPPPADVKRNRPARGNGADAATATPAPPSADEPGPPPAVSGRLGEAGGVRRRLTMFAAGLGGVLVVVGALLLFTGVHHDSKTTGAHAAASATPSARTDAAQPAGVRCAGASCSGKDAVAMGCAKDADAVRTVRTAIVGTTVVEVRYSKVCEAAWGRITGAAPGDVVQVTAGGAKETGSVTAAGDTLAYTPMLAVRDAAGATACVTLASGAHGCAK